MKCNHAYTERGNACAQCFAELEAENAKLRRAAQAVVESDPGLREGDYLYSEDFGLAMQILEAVLREHDTKAG